MMNWKKWKTALAAATLAVSVGLLAGCGGDKAQDSSKATYNIGVVQLVEHGALDAANKGFVDGLASKGFKDNVKFDQQNAQADQSNLQNIAQRFMSNKVDLICAIATPAAQSVANVTKDIPIVATAVTDYEEAKLVESNAKPNTNVTGTTDMNPIKEQIDLMLKLVPNTKTIGTVYCSSEVNSQKQIDIMKAYAQSKGIKVVEATVSTVNDIQQAAQSIVGDVDAIYVPTDNIIASAMPTLIAITDAAKVPVICGEANMVKAGGLATLGVDYYKLGFQTGEMAADILAGKAKPATMAIQSLKEMTLTINAENAKKLGIEIPADLKAQAGIK
ncbi:MAG: ABC transporter substrate-binding protein [Selenomonadales bacterium]|nr:ABC transporter substrate-binding protein [Selenomonadales bacterium]